MLYLTTTPTYAFCPCPQSIFLSLNFTITRMSMESQYPLNPSGGATVVPAGCGVPVQVTASSPGGGVTPRPLAATSIAAGGSPDQEQSQISVGMWNW